MENDMIENGRQELEERGAMRQRAAARLLMQTDERRLDDAGRGALFRVAASGIAGMDVVDPKEMFGRRASEDMGANIDLLRRLVKGEYDLLDDPAVAEWRKVKEQGEEAAAKYADAKIGGNKDAGHMKWGFIAAAGAAVAARNGAAWQNIQPSVEDMNREVAKTNYDSLDEEGKAKWRKERIEDYERRLAAGNPVASFLKMTGGLDDRAKWIVQKAYRTGELGREELKDYSDKERDQILAAVSLMRGDRKTGTLAFIPGVKLDDSESWWGRRKQDLYALQQSFLDIPKDMAATAKDIKDYAAASMLSGADREEAFRRMDEDAAIKAALDQPLAEPSSFLGAMSRGVAENVWFLLPVATEKLGINMMRASQGVKAAEGAKGFFTDLKVTLTPWRAGRPAKEAVKQANAAANELRAAKLAKGVKMVESASKDAALVLDGKAAAGSSREALAIRRQMAAMKRYTDDIRKMEAMSAEAAKRVPKEIAQWWGGAAVREAGGTAMFSSFFREYVDAADAGGISREESVPTGICVGFVNGLVERMWTPGLEGNVAASDVKFCMIDSLAHAIQKTGGATEWLKKAAWKVAANVPRTVATESGVEEPLQQLVTEFGLALNRRQEQLREEGRGDLASALADLWQRASADRILEKTLETYVDAAWESLPGSIGLGLMEIPLSAGGQRLRRWVTGVDEGIADVMQRGIDAWHAVDAHWGEAEANPNRTVEALTAARKAWRDSQGTGVEAIAKATGLDVKTAEVLSQYFSVEADMELVSPRFSAWKDLNLSLADIDENTIRTLLPGYVEGSFVSDPERGIYAARTKLGDGTERAVAYCVGDISDILLSQVAENEKIDSEFGASWDASIDEHNAAGVVDGAIQADMRRKWREMSEAERHDAAVQAALATKGIEHREGGVFELADSKGNVVVVNADDVISLSNGRVGDIGYGAAATQATVRHETFHSLWRFVRGTLDDAEVQQLAKSVGVDVTKKGWEVDLDEKMANQLERYASGHYVAHAISSKLDRFLDSGAGKLVDFFGKIGQGDEVTNPNTGKSYQLKDFYDEVLRGRLGSGALGVALKATKTQGQAPASGQDGDGVRGEAPSVSKSAMPVEVTDEERAAHEEETRGASAAEEPPVSQDTPNSSTPNSPTQAATAEEPADASTPNQRFYRVGLPNSDVKLVGRLEVRDAETGVNTSTDAEYHDRGNQNRDDTSEESRALVEKIGANPDPLQVGTVQPMANNGIVWALPNGDVIIGNHRVNGVRLGYEKGTAGALEKFVREDAARRGIEIGEGVKKPLLVFVLERIESPDGKADEHEVVRLANESQNRGFNVREQAQNDAKILLDNNLLPQMAFRADGRIDEMKSGDAIGKFRQESGAQGMVAEDGSLTEEGQTRIMNASLAALLGRGGNAALLQKIMANAGRLDMQSELRALMKATPELMALAEAKPGYDLREPLADALTLFTEWRDKDEEMRLEKGKSRHDWRERAKDGHRLRGIPWQVHMSQGDMFRTPTPEALILGDMLAEAEELRSFDREDVESAAGKKRVIDLITNYLSDYAAAARAVNTETDDMFGTPPATRAEVLSAQRAKGGADGGARFSVDAVEAQRQYDDVVAGYANADGTKKPGWMKAPNGQPTKLTERQWVQVNTPNFKANYFGFYNLPKHQFNIVSAQTAPFNSVKDGVEWAKSNGVIGVMQPSETNGKGEINISAGSVAEMLNLAQMNKSVSKEAHFAALTQIRNIIRESELADRHPHYAKGADGKRRAENGVVKGVSIDILYGAMNFGAETYRVKTTLRRYSNPNFATKAYAYEVSEIEVLAGKPEDHKRMFGTSSTSITGDILLNGVRNSKGEFVLEDFSKVVDENGEPLVVYRGAPFDPLAQKPGDGVIKPEAYFTADPEYARRYTGNGGKVRAYYLNIRSPFDIRRPECLADLQKVYPDHNFERGRSGALDWAEASTVDGELLRDSFGDKYDGVIYDEGGDPGESGVSYRGISYVPIKGGKRVKSATDNNGDFSENPDVRYSIGGQGGAANIGLKSAADAEQMEKDGASREDIWRTTGWWRGRDGKWRVEIPDVKRKRWDGDPEERHFTGGGEDFYRYRLTELIEDGDFLKAYPAARKIKVEFHKNMPANVGGNFNEATLTIKLPLKYHLTTDWAKEELGEGKSAELNEAGRKTIVHELQHAIQLFESFAKGGSPTEPVRPYALDGETGHALSVFGEAVGLDPTNDRHLLNIANWAQKITSDYTKGDVPQRIVESFEAAAKEAGKTPQEFRDEIERFYDSKTESPMGQYFKLEGEVEARNVQTRLGMTPEERAATPPWATEDVTEDSQIVRFSVDQSRLKPATQEEFDRAIASWGEMKVDGGNAELAKWLFPDGRVLQPKLVPVMGGRAMAASHDSLFEFLDRPERTDPVERFEYGYADALAGGAIRLDLGNAGIEVARRPTDGQLDALYDILDAGYAVMEGEDYDNFAVDVDSETGGNAFTAVYRRGTSARKIVDDLREYFDSGSVPAAAGARYSVAPVYTGTAADYANRSRQGGKDDGPSLLKIGTGEGSQVYGWGLYGSTVRGVAEGYARIATGEMITLRRNGTKIGNVDIKTPQGFAENAFMRFNGDVARAVEDLKKQEKQYRRAAAKGNRFADDAKLCKEAAEYLVQHGSEYEISEAPGSVYEQTFFTDRAPGDESHLLKWYEPVSEEQLGWIGKGLQTSDARLPDGAAEKLKSEVLSPKSSISGGELYWAISDALGSPQSASEFLARAGIDGIKYPVDSYGGKVKDGDKAGWNYVSFRDDNIRVDHKWTDGQMRYSISVTPQMRRETTVDASDMTREKADAALRALAGRDLKNDETGIVAQVNSVQRRKILSGVAVQKSADNGFSAGEHNAAASIIEKLWKHASLGKVDGDKNGDPFVKSIKRFVSPVRLGDKDAYAYLTVKESNERGHRIYSIELEKLEALARKLGAQSPAAQSASVPEGTPQSIPQTGAPAQGGEKRLSVAPPRRQMAYPQLRQMTDDELVSAAVAVRMALGASDKFSDKAVKVNTVQGIMRRLHPDWDTTTVGRESQRVISDAKKFGRQIRDDLDRGVSESRVLAHLPDKMREAFGTEMREEARRGQRLGTFGEKVAGEIEERQARVIEDAVRVQTGLDASVVESTFGVDLSETLMHLADNPLKDGAPASGQSASGDAAGDDAQGGEQKVVDVPAAVAKAVSEVVERSRRYADENAEKRKARKAEQGQGESGDSPDGQAGLGHEEGGDPVAVATRKAGLDLENPRHLAEFVAELTRRYWIKDHGLAQTADVWRDLVAVQFLRKTAQSVYAKLCRELTYSRSRETAMQRIAKFDAVPTVAGLLSEMEFVGALINAQRIRDTKKGMCEKLDLFLREQFGAQGRFKPDREEGARKVSAEAELRARYMRHAMWLTPDAAALEAGELQRTIDELSVDFKDAGRDRDQSREFVDAIRKLNVLREFGALRYRSLGEIESAARWWEDFARGSSDDIVREMSDREIRTKKAAHLLAVAFADPKRANVREGAGDWLNRFITGHMGFVSLLQDCMRGASAADAAAVKDIVDYIAREIQKTGDRSEAEKRRHNDAFHAAVESIYGRGFNAVMKEMMAPDERFAKYMGVVGGKRVTPTKGRALQLLVSLLQEGRRVEVEDEENPGKTKFVWEGGYHDNIVKHHREGQAQELMKLLTPQDMNMLKWLGAWYEQNRSGLSDVCRSLFGIGVYAELPNYFPVKMMLETQGLEKGQGVSWTIFPKALTPRVKNERDFDTSADIFSMWESRMEEAAQWKHHARLGLEMRGIFGRSELREAVRANHGAAVDELMQGFITDILAGQGAVDRTTGGVQYFSDQIRGWTALCALGGNVGVMLKQTTSIPAFGFEIGLVNTAKYMVNAFTPEGMEAMRRIWDSEQRRTRWQVGSSEAVRNALSQKNAGVLKRLLQASMITNKVGDSVPALVIGQGIYRDCLARGMTEEDAMSETWSIIERTQQSGRMENQTSVQRRNKLGRIMFQFLSTQQQYLQYEMRAIREVIACPDSVQRWGNLGRAILLNHFILSSAYFWMGELYKACLGQEPPEDELKDWVISCLLGPYGSLFVAGFCCKYTLERAIKGYSIKGGSSMLPMEAWLKTQVNDGAKMLEAIFDSDGDTWENMLEAAGRWMSDSNSTVRDLRKIYRYRIKGEPQK